MFTKLNSFIQHIQVAEKDAMSFQHMEYTDIII